MIDYAKLAAAASKNDDVAESGGLGPALTDLGLSQRDVMQAAEQRAIRLVMIAGGRTEELAELSRKQEKTPLNLSMEERALLSLLMPAVLDGIAIGIRAGRDA